MCANVRAVSSALCPRPLARERDAPCPSRHRVFALGGDDGGLSGGVAARADARRIASYSSSDFNSMAGERFSFSRGGRCARGRRRRQSIRASASVGRSVGRSRRRVSANPDDIGSIGARERRRDARDARLGARIDAKKKHPSTHPS